MKTGFISLAKDIFTKEWQKSVPHRTRYLLIRINPAFEIPGHYPNSAFQCIEMSSWKEAQEYIKKGISEWDRKNWRLYKEQALSPERKQTEVGK